MPTSRVPRAQDGMTALLWAVDFERTEILSILIAAGASLETENNVRQRASCTACSGMAVFPGALCARRVSFCGVQCVVRIHRMFFSREAQDEETALLRATAHASLIARKNASGVVRVLLAAGANKEATDEVRGACYGWTISRLPIMRACKFVLFLCQFLLCVSTSPFDMPLAGVSLVSESVRYCVNGTIRF
jgi:Ankyrin repeat